MEENHTNFELDNEEQLAENTPSTACDENTDNNDTNEEMQIDEGEDGVQDVEQQPLSERHLSDTEHGPRRSKSDEDEDRLTIPDVLPVLPLKDTVIYPFAVQPLAVGQERSIRLIDEVMRGDRLVVLVAQKSADMEQAGPGDIFRIGTVSRVARMIRMPDGTIQIIVQGLERVAIG